MQQSFLFFLQAEEADWQLWSGVFFQKVRPDSAWDFSGEYQVRLKNDFRELKSHFFDFNAYYKATPSFDVNAGYRFTMRPDRNENRMMPQLCLATETLKHPNSFEMSEYPRRSSGLPCRRSSP